jgi:methyl-accepting chemotaxis protein
VSRSPGAGFSILGPAAPRMLDPSIARADSDALVFDDSGRKSSSVRVGFPQIDRQRKAKPMPNSSTETLLTVFVGLTALAMVVQAVILAVIVFAARKGLQSLRGEFEELRESALPVLKITRDLFERIGPNIGPAASDFVKTAANLKIISTDMATLSTKLRAQVEDVQSSAADMVVQLKQQAERLEKMINETLDAAERLSAFLQTAVTVPAKQVAGVLAAAKAIVGSFRNFEPARRAQPSNDHESFI